MRVDSSEPVGFRYSWRGWAIRLAPGPSQADVEASTAWVLCLGPGTQAGRAIDVP